jgi:hypothetical protein
LTASILDKNECFPAASNGKTKTRCFENNYLEIEMT